MPTRHELGDNLVIEETDSGVQQIKHDQNGTVFEYTPSSDTITTVKDFEAISTEDLDNSDVSKGTTKTVYSGLAANNAGVEVKTQPTDDVSTSAKTILSMGDGIRYGLLIVSGDEQGSDSRFSDVIHAARTGATSTVINSETMGSPSGRTYSFATADLQLAMSANTYDVVVSGLMTRRDINATS